jgi:hypothetical protein
MRLGFLLLSAIEFKGLQAGPGCGEAHPTRPDPIADVRFAVPSAIFEIK